MLLLLFLSSVLFPASFGCAFISFCILFFSFVAKKPVGGVAIFTGMTGAPLLPSNGPSKQGKG